MSRVSVSGLRVRLAWLVAVIIGESLLGFASNSRLSECNDDVSRRGVKDDVISDCVFRLRRPVVLGVLRYFLAFGRLSIL